MSTPSTPAPTELRVRRRQGALLVSWPDGSSHELPFELLRVYSPSAEVRGHGEGQRILQTGKKHVQLSDIEPVGNYAVRISFDDGHDSGIYSWAHLRDLGDHRERYWREYERDLAEAGASRLPATHVGTWQPVRLLDDNAKPGPAADADPPNDSRDS